MTLLKAIFKIYIWSYFKQQMLLMLIFWSFYRIHALFPKYCSVA